MLLDAHPEAGVALDEAAKAAFVLIGTKEVPLGATELSVCYSGLLALSKSIGSLTALTTLDMGGNQLKELPAAIGSLTALTTLDVYNNQLTELPAAIGSLAALTTLDVGRNPLQLPPLAVAERGPAAIRAYFDDNR